MATGAGSGLLFAPFGAQRWKDIDGTRDLFLAV
jgi:hypothetical protein